MRNALKSSIYRTYGSIVGQSMYFLTEQHSNRIKPLKIKEKVAILSDLFTLAGDSVQNGNRLFNNSNTRSTLLLDGHYINFYFLCQRYSYISEE